MKQKSQLSLYWKCQLTGWSVACLYWTYAGYTGTQFSWTLALIHFACDLTIYIAISHGYRIFSLSKSWHRLPPQRLLTRIIPAILVLGFFFMLFTISKNWLVRIVFESDFEESLSNSFSLYGLTTFVTGIRLMTIWLLAYYGYHLAQREITAIKESNRLAIIARDATFSNLSTQLNPHFFFNSLNSIKALVMENPEAARRAIDLLSDLLRTSLYDRDKDLITVNEEMALINDYLELEKIRFEKRLQSTIDIQEETADMLILPLTIQVLVENAIKHGIATRTQGGAVDIKLEKKENRLYVSVKNHGTLNNENTRGLGLKNLQERLALQYNGNASFSILQNNDDTVIATIILPLV